MTFDFKINITNQELQAACALSLKEMFSKEFFSASKLWDCCDILGIGFMQETEIANFVNIHHCISFDKMQPEQIQRLKQVCFAMIGMEPKEETIELPEIFIPIELIEPAYHEFELAPCQY